MLAVTLASAEAYDNSVPEDDGLPHSFSVIACRSLKVIDIMAALARCAMSPSDRPVDLAGLLSTGAGAGGGGGTFIATLTGAASFGFGASATFGAGVAFDASADLGASAGLGASASFGGCGMGATSAAFDATPCGCAAAKRSLNIIGEMDATVAGFALGAGSRNAAKASLTASAALRVAILGGKRTIGSS